MSHINTYKEIGLSTEVIDASPWKLIKLLLDKLMECINIAEQAIQNENNPLKNKKISRADAIVSYLQNLLNFEADKELSERLDGIYHHLLKLLFWANAKNDLEQLKEAKEITGNLIKWWDHVQS